MKNTRPRPKRSASDLRRQAEARATPGSQEVLSLAPGEVKDLVHELHVHQVELEIRNKDLLDTQHQLAVARDRYQHLYEFAPVGYITLDRRALITHVNAAAAFLLAKRHDQLVGTRLETHVAEQDRDACYLLMQRAASRAGAHCGQFRIDARTEDGEWRWAAVELKWVEIESDDGEWRATLHDITEQKRGEAALRDGEERLRLALQSSRMYTWTWNIPSGRISPSVDAAEIIGVAAPFAEAEGRAIIHPDDLERLVAEFMQAIANRTDVATDCRVLRPDTGREVWIHIRGTVEYDENRKPVRMLGTSMDIDDRKKAEEARRILSEQLQQELSDARQLQGISTALIRQENPNALYARIINAAAAMMRSEMATMQVYDAGREALRLIAWKDLHPESAEFWAWVSAEAGTTCGLALGTGERVVVPDIEQCGFTGPHLEAYRKSGIRAVQSTPLKSRDGKFVGMISTHWRSPHQPTDRDFRTFDVLARQAADLLERALAEEALRASEDKFRTIFEHASTGMALIAPDGRLTMVNQQCCNRHGYSREELINKPVLELTHPDDVPALERQLNRIRNGICDSFALESRVVAKDGTITWHSLTVAGVRNAVGDLLYFIKVFEDITRDKMYEAELERRVRSRTALLRLMNNVTVAANAANTVDESLRYALQAICEYQNGGVGHASLLHLESAVLSSDVWYASDPGDLAAVQKMVKNRRNAGRRKTIDEVIASREPVWIDDIVVAASPAGGKHWAHAGSMRAVLMVPVLISNQVVAILEVYGKHPLRRDGGLLDVLKGIGIQLGHVLERKDFERRVADLTAEEQRRMGLFLHDSVSQQLTGLRLLATTLHRELSPTGSQFKERVAHIMEGAEVAQQQVRALMKGLMPVEVAAGGLMSSIEELADRACRTHEIECRFTCPRPIDVDNNTVATQLYYVAREAVHNATKHAHPKHIDIKLASRRRALTLSVKDDGDGIPEGNGATGGMGLRIMRYRCELIGGRFEVDSRPGKGTMVSCTLAEGWRLGEE